MANRALRQHLLLSLAMIGPLLFFVILRFVPATDSVWNQPVPHFYIVSYTSLVALVVAGFVLIGVGTGGGRAMFAAMGFVAMSAFFFVHGISTPGVLITGFNQAVGWSARLSLTSGAILMALGMLDLSPERQYALIRHRRRIWLGLALAFVLYVVVVFGLPEPLQRLSQIELVNVIFAAGTGAILIWSARRAWGNYHSQQDRLSLVLTVALPWLALAQLSQSTAPLWAASWWLYHLFMLGAFGLTMIALIMDYEHIRDFRLSHYFAALGLIVGVPAAVLLGEAAVRLTGFESVRWYMVGFSLVVILFLFLVLLGVVRRAQRILDERAAALQTEKQWRVDLTNLIVHDLKSPLSSILINLDSVLRGRLGAVPEEQQDRLSRARYSTEAMAALIDDLLAVERLEAGALHLTLVANNLTLLLEACMEGMAVLADARQIELTARLADPLPFLPFDEALLQRVMQNLLTNAIKFSPPRSIIHVEAITTPTWVTISVIDSGPGVHPDQRQRIFEKFARVQGVEGRGHGLGLSLCKLVIEAHSGHIWVEDGPDGGSCFAFSLPLSAKQSTVSPDLS